MKARAAFALALLLFGGLGAAAQPAIPPAELPGRERERFFDRFKSPEDLRNDPRLRFDGGARTGKPRTGKPRPAPGDHGGERSNQRRR